MLSGALKTKEELMAKSTLAPAIWESLVELCSGHVKEFDCYPVYCLCQDPVTGQIIFETSEVSKYLSIEDVVFIEAKARAQSADFNAMPVPSSIHSMAGVA